MNTVDGKMENNNIILTLGTIYSRQVAGRHYNYYFISCAPSRGTSTKLYEVEFTLTASSI